MAKPVIVTEAGKVLSSANESKLRQIQQWLTDVLSSAATDTPAESTSESETPVTEALSSSDLAVRLQRALKDTMYTTSTYPYIRDIYPTFFVYTNDYGSKAQAVPYTLGANNLVSLGTPVEVLARTIYENIDGSVFAGSEAAVIDPLDVDLVGDTIQLREDFDLALTEAAAPQTRTIRAKLIAPGKGSSAIYTEAVLKRDGPKVFTKGLHMYVDHPTAKEEQEKPEGTITRLAGTLATNAVYEADNAHGPGLYADINVFPSFYDRLKEIAPVTGLSIRAKGKAIITEANTLPTVQEFTSARSVDFVTMAGAGGKVVELFESYRNVGNGSVSDPIVEGGNGMAVTDEAFTTMQETLATITQQLATLQGSVHNRHVAESATTLTQAALRTSTLPAQAKKQVLDRVLANLPLTEAGIINHEALQALIARESANEAAYLSSMGVGGVRGMGVTGTVDVNESAADLAAEVDKLIMAL